MSRDLAITIGNRSYRMMVDGGQEARVEAVAEVLNSYVSKMQKVAEKNNMDRDRLIVMAGMLLADEFLTMRQSRESERETVERYHARLAERLEALVTSLDVSDA